MTPEEALLNFLKLVEGSDELEEGHALRLLLQIINRCSPNLPCADRKLALKHRFYLEDPLAYK